MARHRNRASLWFAVATAAVVALGSLPASAHPTFPAASGFGFKPNTQGGSGATGAAPPYAAGTKVTLHMRVPFEQVDPYNGSDDTTVDVRAVVPDGWTSPVCGAARKEVIDATTNFTTQPGGTVGGWSCAVVDSAGRKVLHWSGPQVSAPSTAADSAQWFDFEVTTPSPSVQTTYNGTGGTEGFIVDQRYASGTTEHWIPNAAFPGTAPSGATTTVAAGLARTVAAEGDTPTTTTTTTTTTPVPSDGSQVVTAVVEATDGEFAVTMPTNPVISLRAEAAADGSYRFVGDLNPVTVVDTRSAKPAWTVTGQVGDFTGALSGRYLGWFPQILSAGAGAIAGSRVAPGTDGSAGLTVPSILGFASAGHDLGAATLGAGLELDLPATTPAGTYSAVITITAI